MTDIEGCNRRRQPAPGVLFALVVALAASTGGTTWAGAETAGKVQGSDGRLTVPPGGIIRWSGNGIDSCGLDNASWPPYGGACWYPVDLMREPGVVELQRRRFGNLERAAVQLGAYPYPTQRLEVAPEMVSPPADQLERIRRESARVAGLWDLGGQPSFELPLGRPLDPQPEAQSFGFRRVFNGEPRDPHTGVDLRAPKGAPVLAAARGRVAIAAEHYFAGRCVFLDHGDDLITMYFHLDRVDVTEGQTVERGQQIGTVGATGRATGPHLHFGVRWHGARIDPTVLLQGPAAVPDVAAATRD